jgi:hypothetical protein
MAASVLAVSGKTLPLWLARWRDLRERHPYRAALVLGICMAPLGLLLALSVVGILMALVPPELLGKSAAAHLGQMRPGWIVIMTVVYAPLVETLLAQLLPIEIARRLGAGPLLCILPSAFLFGLGHFLNGGLAHGTTTFFGGLVLACAYVALRRAGSGPAFVAAATTHAFMNAAIVPALVAQTTGG